MKKVFGKVLLEEFLEPAGVTRAEFARKLGWKRTRLNDLDQAIGRRKAA